MADVKVAASPQASCDRSWSTTDESSSLCVSTVEHLSDQDFAANYRDSTRPVLLRGGCAAWNACQRWSPQYFDQVAGSLTVPVKTISGGDINISFWRLAEYVRLIMEKQADAVGVTSNVEAIPYCHDIPLLGLVERLVRDCQPFPAKYLTPWYQRHWWRYSQFFMGPAGTVTPLHFDSLLTHNLFFQIYGTKRFTILPPNQAEYCGRQGWRWFNVDPEQPDYGRFPQYQKATPAVITVGAGDILYMPPGTLHHVRSLSASISFNIDWHTKRSVLHALAQSFNGMPRKVIYFNAITALAVIAKIPEAITFPLYRPYLSYVS